MGRNKTDVPVRVLLSCDTRHSAVAANAVLQRLFELAQYPCCLSLIAESMLVQNGPNRTLFATKR
jgi:hypothetical protein